MNVSDLVLVNSPPEYRNEPAIIMTINANNNIYVVKFIQQNNNLGVVYPIYGCNCDHFSLQHLRRSNANEFERILQIPRERLDNRINSVLSFIGFSVNNLNDGDYVLVNGNDDYGNHYFNNPAIILRKDEGTLVQFVDRNIGYRHAVFGENTANFPNNLGFVMADIIDFSNLLSRTLTYYEVNGRVNSIFLGLNPHLDRQQGRRQGGQKRKSFKKKSSNRKKYSSLKKV